MANQFQAKPPTIERTTRTDHVLQLTQDYTGDIRADPRTYNRAFAAVLRAMADELDRIDDQWADPELVVWLHQPGKLTAELPLSEPEA